MSWGQAFPIRLNAQVGAGPQFEATWTNLTNTLELRVVDRDGVDAGDLQIVSEFADFLLPYDGLDLNDPRHALHTHAHARLFDTFLFPHKEKARLPFHRSLSKSQERERERERERSVSSLSKDEDALQARLVTG